VVTDLAEVFRLGTAKVHENLAFCRHLHDRHVPDKPFQILANEVQQQVDCTECANCCRNSEVTVSKAEIDRIASYLDVSPETVIRLYTAAESEGSERRVLASFSDACVFLDGNLCMIYEARPKTCRDFPHVAVGSHTLGGRLASHARWAALCPIIYNTLEVYKRRTGFHPPTH
jgi:Fe-S-cluster containining protein